MPCYQYALVWFILVILCISRLDVVVDLDGEIWLRSCKRYRWCRLMPEGHHGDGLGLASLSRNKECGCIVISPSLSFSYPHSTLYGQGLG
jgi:hypothetical protein